MNMNPRFSHFRTLIAGALTLCIVACGSTSSTNDPQDPKNPQDPTDPMSDVLRSDKTRLTSLKVPDADMKALAEGNNALAFDLYHQLNTEAGNFFISPHSISSALAITFAGARSRTESEMAQALHYTLPQAQLHPAYNNLDLALAQRGQGGKGIDGKGFRLHVSNAAWGQKGYAFAADYLDTLAQHYDAGLHLVDFFKATESARQTINGWVEENTEGKIKELLNQGSLTMDTRLVLTNTIYFNAAWDSVFSENNTADAPFTLLDSSTVQVPTMSQAEDYGYSAGAGYQAVELPYEKKELSMVIVVPDAGQFDSVEKQLDAEFLAKVVSDLKAEMISLSMPKWKLEYKKKLKQPLQALGMTEAFTMQANFSGINGGLEPMWIDDVIHQSFISVNEKGTEAAAATAVVMIGGAMPKLVKVDRPFIYLIRDIATGTVLFVGRVVNPLG
jgi:serpin B